MAILDTTQRYGAVTQVLHWGTAVLIAAAWTLGAAMEELPRGPARAAGLDIHATLGLAVIAAVLARLMWRVANPRPSAGEGLLGLAATATHLALYGAMLAVPLSGLAAQWGRGRAVSALFGTVTLPPPAWLPGGHGWGEVHEVAANLLLVLIGLHVAGAVFHQLVLRDGLLGRMLPARGAQDA
jgi:cytochrome b561